MEFQWNMLSVQEYNDLREMVGWKRVSDAQAEEGLSKSTVLSAREGETVLAAARSVSDGMQSLIVDVMVRPDYQGHGIGTKLMQTLLQREKETTPPDGEKYVSVFAISGMEPFYASLGFLTRPNVLQGPGMTMKLTQGKHFKFEDP